MWQLEYSNEVKLYFLDNYPYTFPLLVRIEELKFLPEGIPAEACIEIEVGLFQWHTLEHYVFYRKETERLLIASVKPAE